ncbi:MAG: response regulator transcription factor [Myxococcales bacterium]|nr:response regulator transcription factor [Myxococcales bacterium]
MSDGRLLVVEDEANIAAGLKLNLELEGFEVEVVRTAREAAGKLLDVDGYDAIVLDVMLPDFDGFELCRRLRAAGNHIPVIMLTARSSAEDRVTGLEAGADDYLVKPFALKELLARVRSALRRRAWERQREAPPPNTRTLAFGDALIDFDTHIVTVRGERLTLTQLELDLIAYFAQNPGRVITRSELLERVWKLRNYPNTRTVDNFLVRLRRYFEKNPAEPTHFLAHRGAGYQFIPNP